MTAKEIATTVNELWDAINDAYQHVKHDLHGDSSNRIGQALAQSAHNAAVALEEDEDTDLHMLKCHLADIADSTCG